MIEEEKVWRVRLVTTGLKYESPCFTEAEAIELFHRFAGNPELEGLMVSLEIQYPTKKIQSGVVWRKAITGEAR